PVENSLNLNGAGLQASGLFRIEGPRHMKILHVLAVDLFQRGKVIIFRGTAVNGPVMIGVRTRAGHSQGCGQEQAKESESNDFVICRSVQEEASLGSAKEYFDPG